MKATFDSETNEFIFDCDAPNIQTPSFTDNHGNALKSAKRLYDAFVADDEINASGVFMLKDKRIPLARMSRYTIVLL
ncbi:MAG: hypothetical protein LBK57_00210, partial [Clostridiales Family XIII bacterium]|nr:hypothetical protein [Clostridiales Family XIII bacterium]